jgi:hypothetical protein
MKVVRDRGVMIAWSGVKVMSGGRYEMLPSRGFRVYVGRRNLYFRVMGLVSHLTWAHRLICFRLLLPPFLFKSRFSADFSFLFNCRSGILRV